MDRNYRIIHSAMVLSISGKGVTLNKGRSQYNEYEDEQRKPSESRLRRYPHFRTDINQLQC